MRSKLGTKARLAAHITAAVLLVLMLVYLVDAPPRPVERWSPGSIRPSSVVVTPAPAATMDQVAVVDSHPPIPEEQLRPPPPEPEHKTPEPQETAEIPDPPAPVASRPEQGEPKSPIPPEQPVPEPEPPSEPKAGENVKEAISEPEPEPELKSEPKPEPKPELEPKSEPEPESGIEPVTPPAVVPEAADAKAPETPEETHAPATSEAETETPAETPSASQPDESGSLVVAASETDVKGPVAAIAPLANANLEVLGDGVYWLGPGYDLEQELAAIPEVGSLILLTPLPGYRVEGFEHVKTAAIPAGSDDLTLDAVEQFLHVASESRHPVVAAALPGARGAAYFKGAYLLLKRNMELPEALREIAPELEEAGEAREEIEHRLGNLAAK